MNLEPGQTIWIRRSWPSPSTKEGKFVRWLPGNMYAVADVGYDWPWVHIHVKRADILTEKPNED